ncbi:unnamed protein product [Lactuca saligna]|uniref:Wall-associated receptor kinase galacturonan-binding domain-containing protein n=1 Tax=Lactuca saligna TaxID=75948 RepID=A0AA35YEJ5_LACSI|nr:unnamed protein product [Lactuca saligna]
MQVFRVLHLLILISLTRTTTLTKAKSISKKGCNDTCGGILIPFPFGIGRNCFLNKWYNVDCNSSIPYLPSLNNVEVLHASSTGDVIVNVSMTFDCENSMQNSTLVLSDESPFAISVYDNSFFVKGCGNIYANVTKSGSIVAGCSTICRKKTVSDRNNCFGVGCCQSTFSYYLESFNLNRTGLKRPVGDGSCGTAFFMNSAYFEKGFPRQSIDGDNIYVPITLSLIYSASGDVSSPECKWCEMKGGYCSINVDAASGTSCYIYGRSKKIGVILGKLFS